MGEDFLRREYRLIQWVMICHHVHLRAMLSSGVCVLILDHINCFTFDGMNYLTVFLSIFMLEKVGASYLLFLGLEEFGFELRGVPRGVLLSAYEFSNSAELVSGTTSLS